MSLITVGTMAFDAIETPFGKIDQIIGGSATYVAYAASNFIKPVQQISIVGYDFPESEMKELQKRGVITYVRGTITLLDRPKLEAIVCECYGVVKNEYDRLLGK